MRNAHSHAKSRSCVDTLEMAQQQDSCFLCGKEPHPQNKVFLKEEEEPFITVKEIMLAEENETFLSKAVCCKSGCYSTLRRLAKLRRETEELKRVKLDLYTSIEAGQLQQQLLMTRPRQVVKVIAHKVALIESMVVGKDFCMICQLKSSVSACRLFRKPC